MPYPIASIQAAVGSRAARAGAAWNPSDLSGLVLELLAEKDTFQDAGGTTPAAVTNDLIRLWKDQSGSGNHVASASDGKRPYIVTGQLNGLPLVRFLIAGSTALTKAFTLAQPFTMVTLANAKSDYGEVFGSPGAALLRYNAKWGMYAGAYKGGAIQCAGAQMVVAVFNGASSFIRVNEVQEQLSPGTAGLNALTVGNSGNAETVDGYSFHLFNRVLDSDEIVLMESFYRRRYGMRDFMTVGDSKAAHGYWWQNNLRVLLETSTSRPWNEGVPHAAAGWTVSNAKAGIDAYLASRSKTPESVLINLGVNEISPTEGAWKADYQYILDAIHSKYPSTQVYLSRVWKRSFPLHTTLNGWINDLVSANPTFCHAGDDESVWLEGGNDGATMTVDGVHYSAAGMAEKAAQMKAVMGL